MGREPRPGRRPGFVYLTLVAVAASVAACDAGTDPSSQWTITTDTLPNGATRVVNTPPAEGDEPVWWIEEDLRIGSFDSPGPTSFGEIRGIAVTTTGDVVVLEAQSQELRVFNPDGTHRATYGGKGGGPGELENGFGLMVDPTGLLWVPDNRNARMSVFHPTDGFVRSHPLRLLRFGYIWGGVMDSQGRILKSSMILEEDRRPVIRVFDLEMNEVETRALPPEPVIDQEDPPTSFAFKTENGGGFRSVPWFPRSSTLLDPDGEVWSTRFADPSYRILRWMPGGDTTLVIETPRAVVAVTPAERDSAIAAARESIESMGGTPPGDWSKIPQMKPAIEGMFVSDEGQLWVRRASDDGITHYDVYERDGRWVGGAATDLRIFPYLAPQVRGGEFIAVVTDELDVPYVVRGRMLPFECRAGNPAVAETSSVCRSVRSGSR